MSTTKQAGVLSLNPEDAHMVKQWLLGGAGVGGGTALVAAAIKYLRDLNRDTSEDDDDTLYVYHKKPQEKKAGVGAGLSITGGPLAAIGTYALVNKILAEIEKKQAQEELDEAQLAFIDSKGYETAKMRRKRALEQRDSAESGNLQEKAAAGKPMDIGELPTGLAVSLPIIIALAGGATTKSILDNNYPLPKKKVKAPRKIEIIDPDEEERARREVAERAAAEEAIKEASAEDRNEFLIRLVSREKRACDTRNAIAALAGTQARSFMNAVRNVGFVAALNTVKSASAAKLNPMREHIAVSCLATAPELKAPASVIAASEFANMYPMFTKAASVLPETLQEKLLKIASFYGRAVRIQHSNELGITGEVEPIPHEKIASASLAMLSMLANPSSAVDAVTDPENIAGQLMQTNQSSGMESDEMLDNKEEQDDDSGDDKPKLVAGSAAGNDLARELDALDSLDVILNPKAGKTIDMDRD